MMFTLNHFNGGLKEMKVSELINTEKMLEEALEYMEYADLFDRYEYKIGDNGDLYLVSTNNSRKRKEVNLTVGMAYILGLNQRVHSLIDEIYYEKKRDESLAEGVLFPPCFVENGLYVKKAYIILKEDMGKQFSDTYRLANRAFKTSYQYFKSGNCRTLSFAKVYAKKAKFNFVPKEIDIETMSLVYLIGHAGAKDVLMWNRVIDVFILTMNYIEPLELSFGGMDREEIEEYDIGDFWVAKEKSLTLSQYIFSFERKFLGVDENTPIKIDKDIKKLTKETMLGDIEGFILLLKMLNIDFGLDFDDKVITKYEMIKLLLLIDETYRSMGRKEADVRDARIIVSACIIIKFLYEEYKKLEDFYYKSKAEDKKDHEMEINKLNSLLNEKVAEVETLKSQLEKLKESISNRINVLENSNKLLEKENLLLKKELDEVSQLKKELFALRTMVYRNGESKPVEMSRQEMIEEISLYKVAVIGGHYNWVSKMREVLPKVDFIDLHDNVGRDMRKLSSYDYVVINTAFMNHSAYNKVVANIEGELRYINTHVNIDLSIKELYNALFEG